MKILCNDNWELYEAPLTRTSENYSESFDSPPMPCTLPCDVHMPLLAEKRIKDPAISDYSYDSAWVSDRSWWFKHKFFIDNNRYGFQRTELHFEKLDYNADIFVNGTHIGHHQNAHRPFSANIKALISEGVNEITVRLTVGTETINRDELDPIREYVCSEEKDNRGDRGDGRRAMLRKPQYVFGWDWSPSCPSCGITGDVWLEFSNKVSLRHIIPATLSISPSKNDLHAARQRFTLVLENTNCGASYDANLNLTIKTTGGTIVAVETADKYLLSGTNYINIDFDLPEILLWWPAGMGAPNLYILELTVHCGEDEIKEHRTFGIRTTEILNDKCSDGRLFAIKVNGIRSYCKGGNLIPSDVIYARTDYNKYYELISAAVEANFNMLRIWGGGNFEREIFYQICDEKGIMIWQDFMFACSMIPEYLPWFREEVRLEIDYQTKHYSAHPCIVLWCGNNENHQFYSLKTKADGSPLPFYGKYIYNQLAPEIIRKNTPHIPYWNGSPYGGEHANSYEAGDCHAWGETMMNADMEVRINPLQYDTVKAKFISEYGYVGTCMKSSILKYMDGNPLDPSDRVWQLHNNTFEKETVSAGIMKHYADPDKITIDEYLLYAGLCQGLMLSSSFEAFRSQLNNSGCLFWMYNDCWGETGWTIIDYYLTRKISYYYAKRAFAHKKILIRQINNKAIFTYANDTCEPVDTMCTYGYMSYDGTINESESTKVTSARFTRCVIACSDISSHDLSSGIIYAKSEETGTSVMTDGLYREKNIPKSPMITIETFNKHDRNITLTVHSDVYAHGVHFNIPDTVKCSDCYFDLLPGEIKNVTLFNVPDEIDATEITAHSINIR